VILVDPMMTTSVNCMSCSCAGCMMETSGQNEPGNHSSSMIGDGDIGETDVASPLVVASCGTPRTPIEGTSDASHIVTPVMQAALDPLMHTTMLNRPQGVSPSAIQTPPNESYTHVSLHDFCNNIYILFPLCPDVFLMQREHVLDVFVPKDGLTFDDLDDAYELYCDYAKLAGFDVRKSRKRTWVSWYVCNKERFWESKSDDKQTEKGSMREGCKAEVRVKLDTKGNYWYYDIVTLLHNHKLHPESRMVHFMRLHKNMEDGIKNLLNLMTHAGVQHQAQMYVMSELHGGRDNWQFSERDVKNR
jgi:hypothetical protein